MRDEENQVDDEMPNRSGMIGLIVAIISVLVTAGAWAMDWKLLFLLSAGFVIAVVIWQACDPFADAAQWVGKALHLPGSVRGATLDAVASSMPELFSGIFFVVVAIRASEEGGLMANVGAEGYGATIATCAGSAIYNMILIPAVVALVVSFRRKENPVVVVEDKVILRDGMWFLGTNALLIAFLFMPAMHWWMAIVFILLYAVYIFHLFTHARRFRGQLRAIRSHFDTEGDSRDAGAVTAALAADGIKIRESMVHRVRSEDGYGEEDADGKDDSAGVFFGFFDIGLNKTSVTIIIIASTVVAAAACYFLVAVTRETAVVLSIPTFFVAVILAAAVSSVPDTFISIGAAMRGDDSGAVANAFGSNIFDICICLSVPLLVNSYLTGWGPVSMMQNGEPMPGIAGLRILLCILTLLTLGILWHKRQITRGKAYVLVALYLVFVGYAVCGSLGWL
jgi:Ca2+/Na+ antiporter